MQKNKPITIQVSEKTISRVLGAFAPEPQVSADLWLCGDVNDHMLDKFFDFYVRITDPNTVITCHLSSGGGDVDTGFAIHDALRCLPNKVIMIGYGSVGSIATVIFCAGKERLLTPNTTLLIHPVSAELSGDFKGMQAAVKSVADSQERIIETLSGRSTDPAFIRRAAQTETFIDAEKSMELGLATGILEFTD